ncbi:hypothetical protein AMTRI_Chr09g13190 [Amborella trichopoda]
MRPLSVSSICQNLLTKPFLQHHLIYIKTIICQNPLTKPFLQYHLIYIKTPSVSKPLCDKTASPKERKTAYHHVKPLCKNHYEITNHQKKPQNHSEIVKLLLNHKPLRNHKTTLKPQNHYETVQLDLQPPHVNPRLEPDTITDLISSHFRGVIEGRSY